MNGIEKNESKMTIFFSKSTGKIKAVCGGIQDLNYFGEDKEDYNYNFVVIDYNLNLFNNFFKYKVIDNSISLKEEYREELLINL